MTGRDLPVGWRLAELGEICQPDRVAITRSDEAYATMPYLGLEHIEPATGRILVDEPDAQASDSKSTNFRFTEEHVLYGKLRPYLNKVALPEFSGRCTTEIIPLRPTSVERRWLAWLLRRQEAVDHAMRGKTGSRMPRASMPDFLAMKVAVPPLQEQRRAIARLERQFSAAARARTAMSSGIAALSALAAALLRDTFPLRGPRSRLPPNWRRGKLGEVCEIVNGSTPVQVRRFWGGSICWITPTDLGQLQGSDIDRSARTITKAGYESCSTTLVPAGAVIMSSRAPIGHLGIATIPLCTNQGCKAFVPTPAIETRYLYHALRFALDDIRSLGSGAVFPEVGKKKLAYFEIPLPSNKREQLEIADALDRQAAAVKRAETASEAQLATIDALSKAALQEAFHP